MCFICSDNFIIGKNDRYKIHTSFCTNITTIPFFNYFIEGEGKCCEKITHMICGFNKKLLTISEKYTDLITLNCYMCNSLLEIPDTL